MSDTDRAIVTLVVLGLAYSIWLVSLAWLVLGAGMGMGLYDAAFAALGRIYGSTARPSITGITLLARFASTVGWPLSAWGLAEVGWRETCFAWAAAHILIGLPLNLFLLPKAERAEGEQRSSRTSRWIATCGFRRRPLPLPGRSQARWLHIAAAEKN